MKTYTHLQYEERCIIEKLLDKGSTIRNMALFLERSPNTISRELRINIVNGIYNAKKAHTKNHQRRWRAKRQCLKVSMDSFLATFVERKITDKWSPHQISGYLKKEFGIMCSAKAIYKYIEHRGLDYHLFWK